MIASLKGVTKWIVGDGIQKYGWLGGMISVGPGCRNYECLAGSEYDFDKLGFLRGRDVVFGFVT